MRTLKLFWKANKFPFSMIRNYIRFSTKSELCFDLLFPGILTFIVMYLANYTAPDLNSFLIGIDNINKQSLTSISILAGFNIASISVLATAGSSLIIRLRNTKSRKQEDKSLFEVMVTYFCAAIILQFFIILAGLLLLVASSISGFFETTVNSDVPNYLWILAGAWVFVIITSIFVSLRNLKILFHVVVFETDE